MTDPETPPSPPEEALVAQRVVCRVVGVRPSESAVKRRVGDIGEIAGTAIVCTTTYSARRAEVAEMERPAQSLRGQDDPLAGPLPPRSCGQPHAAVAVRAAQR